VSRHNVDPTSLVAGLVFVVIGIAYVLDAADVLTVQAKWVVPLALIGLGVAGLAGSILRAWQERPGQQPPEPAGAEPEDPGTTAG
jgi:hypothetical protein